MKPDEITSEPGENSAQQETRQGEQEATIKWQRKRKVRMRGRKIETQEFQRLV